MPFQRKKMVVIQNLANFPEHNAKDVYNSKSKWILSVGRADPVKGYDRLIEIAGKLKDSHPDWQWHIWGDFDSSYGEELLKKIHRLRLDSFIKYKGTSDDIWKIYPQYAMFVMTSYYEGMPMVLMEARHSGLPLLSFDIQTGPAELIRNGENGYLIRNGDIEEMTERIHGLIGNESERKRLSENAILDDLKYDEKKIKNKWLKVIRKCGL